METNFLYSQSESGIDEFDVMYCVQSILLKIFKPVDDIAIKPILSASMHTASTDQSEISDVSGVNFKNVSSDVNTLKPPKEVAIHLL